MPIITTKQLQALTNHDVGKRLIDDGGLSGKVRLRRQKVIVQFEYRFRSRDRTRQIVCGTWPDQSLTQIRAARNRYRVSVSNGVDPLEAQRAEQLKKQADLADAIAKQNARLETARSIASRITVNELFDRWATVELVRRKDQGQEVRRMFHKDVLPFLGALAVEDVRKGHITAVTDALLARKVPRMAKVVLSLVRQMFRYAVDRDVIESDPTAAIRKSRIGGKTPERDRVLSESEIRALWHQMPDAGLHLATELAAWIALATCCRIGELLRAEWQHVSIEERQWYIPEQHSKNAKAHTVFLSDFAITQFESLQRLTGYSSWCFPNRHDTAHVCVKTVTKQIGDRQRGESPPMSHRSSAANALALKGGRWTPHDLRRTGATMMTALGVLPEVAEKCLNHVEESRVKRTYQRYSYEREKRDAWRVLGERLEVLTTNGDSIVLPLFPAARGT